MTRAPLRVLAVDLGATSVRVVAVDLDAPEPAAQVLHRWHHQPFRHQDGSLRWDWHGILREVERGLELGLAAGPVASIGVDGWGVDYGLLDGRGALLSPPYCYRDDRTEGWRTTAERIGADHLYAVTGIQLLYLNTIFQLAAHDRSELRRAARLLLLPDLVVRMLTGFVGSWRGVGVHTVGSHDTASAFVGVPGVPGSGSVVVSSGTWVLVGAERPTADTSEKARDANFSNEAGALGGVRFLKNVTGFWLLERCRAAWGNPTVEELVAAAAGVRGPVRTVDPADARFLAPADMEAEIRAAAGLGTAASRAEVVRCILESIASATARITDELVAVTGTPVDELLVGGGAARTRLTPARQARHAGVPVTVGSPEATALGNAVVQGLALGQFERLEDARRWLAIGAERLVM